MPDRTDWKRLIESYNFAPGRIDLRPTVVELERRKGRETSEKFYKVQTSSTGQSRCHRPGSLEHGGFEYGDFWSRPLPPSLENMLAAKHFLIDRAVFTSSTGQS